MIRCGRFCAMPMQWSLVQVQGFLPRQVLPMTGNGSGNIFPILRQSTASGICTPAAFIHILRRKSTGLTGAAIFTSTVIRTRPSRCIKTCSLVKDKDYFVLTTNVDHCFQKAGFDKKRLFYTQGDYGLFQCSEPCCQETYDNDKLIRQMVEAQGYIIAPDGQLTVPENTILKTYIPSELVPHCPHCGRPMSMNLRADDTFVEDVGWHTAADRYSEFLRRHEGQRILFLELGVGYNTPVIIKYPFWRMTAKNPNAFYVCINQGQAICPPEIERQSVCIHGDIGAVIAQL